MWLRADSLAMDFAAVLAKVKATAPTVRCVMTIASAPDKAMARSLRPSNAAVAEPVTFEPKGAAQTRF